MASFSPCVPATSTSMRRYSALVASKLRLSTSLPPIGKRRAVMSNQCNTCCSETAEVVNYVDHQHTILSLFPTVHGATKAVPVLIDSHCHLQLDPLFEKRSTVVSNALSNNVQVLSVCGVCPGEDWLRVSTVLQEYPNNVIGHFGVHPWWIERVLSSSVDWQSELEGKLLEFPGSGVGECGLDKKLQNSVSAAEQDRILTIHIRLALKYRRPLTVHCVGKWGLLWEIFKRELGESRSVSKSADEQPQSLSIILHSCNSLSVDMVPNFLRLSSRVYFSFSGGGNLEKSIQLMRAVPRDRILLETDSPDQLIGDLKGKLAHNEPCVLQHHCEVYANGLGIASSELASITQENSLNSLRISLTKI